MRTDFGANPEFGKKYIALALDGKRTADKNIENVDLAHISNVISLGNEFTIELIEELSAWKTYRDFEPTDCPCIAIDENGQMSLVMALHYDGRAEFFTLVLETGNLYVGQARGKNTYISNWKLVSNAINSRDLTLIDFNA
jgi:hypothetical protein